MWASVQRLGAFPLVPVDQGVGGVNEEFDNGSSDTGGLAVGPGGTGQQDDDVQIAGDGGLPACETAGEDGGPGVRELRGPRWTAPLSTPWCGECSPTMRRSGDACRDRQSPGAVRLPVQRRSSTTTVLSSVLVLTLRRSTGHTGHRHDASCLTVAREAARRLTA